MNDPRTRGFNYGPTTDAPDPEWLPSARGYLASLRRRARYIGDKAWTFEMAERDVRLAVTPEEKKTASDRLFKLYSAALYWEGVK